MWDWYLVTNQIWEFHCDVMVYNEYWWFIMVCMSPVRHLMIFWWTSKVLQNLWAWWSLWWSDGDLVLVGGGVMILIDLDDIYHKHVLGKHHFFQRGRPAIWTKDFFYRIIVGTYIGGVIKFTFMSVLLFCPGFLQACRALMIIALILGLASMIMAIMGLKCISIGSASDQAKSKMAATGGILFLLAGEFSVAMWGFIFHTTESLN